MVCASATTFFYEHSSTTHAQRFAQYKAQEATTSVVSLNKLLEADVKDAQTKQATAEKALQATKAELDSLRQVRCVRLAHCFVVDVCLFIVRSTLRALCACVRSLCRWCLRCTITVFFPVLLVLALVRADARRIEARSRQSERTPRTRANGTLGRQEQSGDARRDGALRTA